MAHKDPEARRAYNRQYYSTPEWKERMRDYQRRWRENNKDKTRESQRRYRETHKEEIYQQRRERRAGAALKEYTLRNAHRMELGQWEEMWQTQDGKCYLCEQPMTLPHPGRGTARKSDATVDHDHDCCPPGKSCSDCWRGLAHRSCNALIGMAGDSPERLRLIARNLEKATGGDYGQPS